MGCDMLSLGQACDLWGPSEPFMDLCPATVSFTSVLPVFSLAELAIPLARMLLDEPPRPPLCPHCPSLHR